MMGQFERSSHGIRVIVVLKVVGKLEELLSQYLMGY